MAIGYDRQEIARNLMITLNTVKTHIGHIYEKTETRNALQLARALMQVEHPTGGGSRSSEAMMRSACLFGNCIFARRLPSLRS